MDKAANGDDVSFALDYSKLQKSIVAKLEASSASDSAKDVADIAMTVSRASLERLHDTITHASDALGAEFGTKDASLMEAEVSIALPKAILRTDGVLYRSKACWSNGTVNKISEDVQIKGIRCNCIIGVNKHEREEKQQVVMELQFAEPAPNKRQDSRSGVVSCLQNTIRTLAEVGCLHAENNISGSENFSDSMAQELEQSSYFTVEALATKLSRSVPNDTWFNLVTVSVDKPSAIPFVEYSGVEVTRLFQ